MIAGFSPAEGQIVSIDQLQAEAGRDGLRAKALETDVLRPLIRGAGGLQALISQTNTIRSLIDKAGGLRELEQFVSDLRTIRDALDELRDSRGLVGLAAEVRGLIQSKQKHAELLSEVNGQNGLRARAAKYEKLAHAFADLQTNTTPQHPSAGNVAMNPVRARMISARPLEADPDRDLYEAPLLVAKPNNRTGSNNTPLGTPQVQPDKLSLKRKAPANTPSSTPAKRPRVDVGRASVLVQVSLPATASSSVDQLTGPKNPPGKRAGTAGVKARTQAVSVRATDSLLGQSNTTNTQGKAASLEARPHASQAQGESAKVGIVYSGPKVQTRPPPTKMPDWMRPDVRFGDVGFVASAGALGCSSTPPGQDTGPHKDVRSEPVRLPTNKLSLPPASSANKLQRSSEEQTPFAPISAGLYDAQLDALRKFLKHPIALWVGSADGYTTWDAYQSYDLKRDAQVPDELLAFLLCEFAKHIKLGTPACSRFEQMVPSSSTCILQ